MKIRTRWTPIAAAAILCLASPSLADPPTVVYSTDFESGMPPEFSAAGAGIEGVQGYAGLGPVGRQFGGNFLRYSSVTLYPTILTVRNLPPHDHLSVKFLQAIIDSWDNTEVLQIDVDGVRKFAHRFSLAVADTTDYFPAPAGAILSMGTNLGFSGCCYYNRDRAYDLGVEPAFLDIPHTADTVQVVWSIGAVSGPAADQWQGGYDESWAIDAVRVEVSTAATGVAGEFPGGRLAIGAFPNPARGGSLRLSVSLPAAEPARVELVDLAGRRLASRELAGFTAGRHEVRLDSGTRLAPGLYFARIVQGHESRSTRIVVTD